MMAETERELLQAWDGLGVVQSYDRETGSWIFIALHDSTLGMMVGGCRMKTYPSPAAALKDAMRLAQGMTYKWAALGFPFGGGKSVLAVPKPLRGDERAGLFHRFGHLLEALNGAYATGEDLGTTPADMDVLAEATRFVMGHGATGGGAEDPGPYTALGVYSGIRSSLKRVKGHPEVAGRRILIQGAGDVGAPLARMLAEDGADILVSDLDESTASAIAAETGGVLVPTADTYDTECDVFAPCAVGAILDSDTIPRLQCEIVAGSANNQLDRAEDAERLHERGILYAPDYVINAGGAVAFGLFYQGERDLEAIRARVRLIEDTLDRVFAEAAERDESPVHAARRIAEAELSGEGEPIGAPA